MPFPYPRILLDSGQPSLPGIKNGPNPVRPENYIGLKEEFSRLRERPHGGGDSVIDRLRKIEGVLFAPWEQFVIFDGDFPTNGRRK